MCPIVALIRRVLDERPTHTAPYRRFSEELEDVMSQEYADETMDAAINWGRYAELFSYDEQSQTFSLENPSRRASAASPSSLPRRSGGGDRA